MQIAEVVGHNWKEFLDSDEALLILGKTNCASCKRWVEQLKALDENEFGGLKIGKMMLNTPGLSSFKQSQTWLGKEVRDLPYNTIWKHGSRIKSWPGGGLERLLHRLEKIREDKK